ncbi:uncharacterized protein LOC144449424 [Glandiceps talaboti]
MKTESWARNRFCLLIVVIGYILMLVIVSAQSYYHFAAFKNSVMMIQAVFLYLLLLVSNRHGPLGCFYPSPGVYPPSRQVTYLSFVLFSFASIIDLMHFARITLVETSTAWGNDDYDVTDEDDDDDESFSVVGVIGLTSHIALRLDFAVYFWEMACVGFSEKLEIYGGENTILRDVTADWIETGRNRQSADTYAYEDVENDSTEREMDSVNIFVEVEPLVQHFQNGTHNSRTYGSRDSVSTVI